MHMNKQLLVVVAVLCLCVGIEGFENYKEAFDSGMKKTEGFAPYQAAREDFNSALTFAKKPEEIADAIFEIGETFYWEGNYQQARQEYLKVTGISNINADYIAMVQIRIGDSFTAEKNYGQAREEYGKVLTMSGKVGNTSKRRARDASLPKVEAQYKIAETYRAEGNYAKAKEEFAKIQQMEDASEKDKVEVKYRLRFIYR